MSTLRKFVRKDSNNLKLTPKKEIVSLTSNLSSNPSKKQMKVPSDKLNSNTRNANLGNKNIFEIDNREIVDDLQQDTSRISANYKDGKSIAMINQLSPPHLLSHQTQENSYFNTTILSEQIDKLSQEVQNFSSKIKAEIENQKLFLKKDKLDYNMRIKEYNSLNETINKEEEHIYSKIKCYDKLKVKEKLSLSAFSEASIKCFKQVFTEKFKSIALSNPYLSLVRQLFNLYFNSKFDEMEISVDNESFVSSKDKNEEFLESLGYISHNIKSPHDIYSFIISFKDNAKCKYDDIHILICNLKDKWAENTYALANFNQIIEMVETFIERELVLKEINTLQGGMVSLVNNKDKIFLILKELESHILVNDNNFKNNTKLLKMVTGLLERVKALNDTKKTPAKDQFSHYNQIKFSFDEISKSEIIKVQKKPANFYNLTLKSEYSDEQDRNYTDRYGAGSFVVQDEIRKHSRTTATPFNPKANIYQSQSMKFDACTASSNIVGNNRSTQPPNKTKSFVNCPDSKRENEEVANLKMANKNSSTKKIDGQNDPNIESDKNILNNSGRSKGRKHISNLVPKSKLSAIITTSSNKSTTMQNNESIANMKVTTGTSQNAVDPDKKPLRSCKIIESNSSKNYYAMEYQTEVKGQTSSITSSIININNNNNYFIIEKDLESPKIIHDMIANHINSTISKSLIQSYKETLTNEKPKIKLNLNNSDLMEPVKSDFQNFYKFKSEHNSQKEESVYGNNHSIDVNLMNYEKDCCNSNDLFNSTNMLLGKSISLDSKLMISPLSKIPLRCSKRIRDAQQINNSNSIIESRKKKIPDYSSLKFDKHDSNPSACCVSCG